MTDNAKCAGVGCSIRDACLRFTRPAVDGERWMEPRWADYLVNADIGIRKVSRCLDHQPLPVEPHGGAPEEGDGA